MSKLKTVWDAVNELRGDLSNAHCRSIGVNDKKLYFNKAENNYIALIHKPIWVPEIYESTCTTAEFNALVEEMELGLDVNPINLGHYLNYVDADKTLLEKEIKPDYTSLEFWKDAPEGYNAFMPEGENWHASWFSLLGGKPKLMMRVEGKIEYNADCYHVDALMSDGLILRPINKHSVYTQEMADNGELPSVGMKCLYRDFTTGNHILVEVMYISEWAIVIKQVDDGYGQNVEIAKHVSDVNLKPIDQRTKKEKAIYDIVKTLERSMAYKEAAEIIYNEWVGE